MNYQVFINIAISAINLTASIVTLSSVLKGNPSYDNLTKGEKQSLGKKFKSYISEHKEEDIEIIIRGKRTLYKRISESQTEE